MSGVSAASRRSRSSVQPVLRGSRAARRTTFGREDLRDLDQVRPQRRDDDHAVARRDQRFDGQHQRRHARRSDGDPRPAPSRGADRDTYARDRVAQLRNAEVLRIERLAARERCAAASRMNAGVTSSGSPNQNGSMPASPMPALATSRICDATERAHGGAGGGGMRGGIGHDGGRGVRRAWAAVIRVLAAGGNAILRQRAAADSRMASVRLRMSIRLNILAIVACGAAGAGAAYGVLGLLDGTAWRRSSPRSSAWSSQRPLLGGGLHGCLRAAGWIR